MPTVVKIIIEIVAGCIGLLLIIFAIGEISVALQNTKRAKKAQYEKKRKEAERDIKDKQNVTQKEIEAGLVDDLECLELFIGGEAMVDEGVTDDYSPDLFAAKVSRMDEGNDPGFTHCSNGSQTVFIQPRICTELGPEQFRIITGTDGYDIIIRDFEQEEPLMHPYGKCIHKEHFEDAQSAIREAEKRGFVKAS